MSDAAGEHTNQMRPKHTQQTRAKKSDAERLRKRLLRTVDYNCGLYVKLRTDGQYADAAHRLLRAEQFAEVVDRAEQAGLVQLSERERVDVELVKKHAKAIRGDNVLDFPPALTQN